MRRKKVLVWETLSTVSGGQKMTLTVMDLLSDTYEFCCLIPSKGLLSDELEKRNIPYYLLGDQTLRTGVKGVSMFFKYGAMSLRSILKSLNVIRKYKPDVLYAPGPASLPWSAVCGLLVHRPVIWHLHHIFLDSTTKTLLNICAHWRSVKQIIAVSNCVGSQITSPIAHKKVKVIYNPVDVEKYANGNAKSIIEEIESKLERRLCRNDKTIIIGHIALVQHSKKQDFALEITRRLKEKGHDCITIFAGGCREQDYYEELQEKVIEWNLQSNVIFMGRRNDIPDILRSIDVLLIPSSEGFPLAGLEALAASVPVVACNVAGASEFINVSHGGVAYDDDNVDMALNALERVMKNHGQFSTEGKKFAQSMSETHYKECIEGCFSAAIV